MLTIDIPARALTLEQAQARYPHRYTMQHAPQWARTQASNGRFYAPQFRTDQEWYENTAFPGEPGHIGDNRHCYTTGQTWPLGKWLERPFRN